MANTIQVNLQFNADVSKAKQQIDSLQQSLDNIMRLKANSSFNTAGLLQQDLEKASVAAATLRVHLQDAFNVRTGKLDFVKLNQSLVQSGMTAQSLKATFQSIGPAGQQAFLQFSQAVATSEIPIIRISDRMRKLGTVMANTVRWQISSTILHGFIRSISSAYNYAKDLNESLNKIRIVTGQSVEQMDAFADRVNKAAKALSASTLAYTDAALIYYQQGLDDKQVEERTNVTMKMANITGESAKEVSSQMTAIWNNFADGSDNLEYFGDVITALGAKTASSSAEIAEGLQKFAAVADTVGLSYEKATAALATVVAETRLSADTVGTSFKTIFARLESLSLGDTLEDGVNLTKYSEALAKVGVNILDQQGQLKQMDTILDELGTKWQTLGEEQQVALANTVAGVRQYAQFIALMSNYDKVLANQQIAETSQGTVQKQQDIYAESWEAASKRVKAALEGLYTTLLDDQAFISITDGLAKIINSVKSFTDSLGGLKGILLIVSSLLVNTFSTELSSRLTMLGTSVSAMFPGGKQRLEAKRNQYMDEAVSMYDNGTTGGKASATGARSMIENAQAQGEFNRTATTQQQQIAELLRQRADEAGREAIKQGDLLQLYEQQLKILTAQSSLNKEKFFKKEELSDAALDRLGIVQNREDWKNSEDLKEMAWDQGTKARDTALIEGKQLGQVAALNENISKGEIDTVSQEMISTIEAYKKSLKEGQDLSEQLGKSGADAFRKIEAAIEKTRAAQKKYDNETKKIDEKVKKKEITEEEGKQQKQGLKTSYEEETEEAARQATEGVQQLDQAQRELEHSTQENIDLASDLGVVEKEAFTGTVGAAQQAGEQLVNTAISTDQARQSTENYKNTLDQLKNSVMGMGQSFVAVGSAAMQTAMAVNAIKSIGNIWSKDDISTGEKLLQTLMSLSMILPVIRTLTDATTRSKLAEAASTMYYNAAYAGTIVLEKLGIVTKTAATAADYAKAASGWAALGPALVFVAIAAAVIAALYGIYRIIKMLAEAETEEAKALREANEELEASKEAAQNTKKAYEEVKNAIEDYNSALDALQQYTKGTEEWYEATKKLNEEINNLITQYPELLKQKNLYNADGTLNQEVLDNFVESKENAVRGATARQIQAQNSVAVAETNKVRVDFVNDIANKNRQYDEYGNDYSPTGFTNEVIRLLEKDYSNKKLLELKNDENFNEIISKLGKTYSLEDAAINNIIEDIIANQEAFNSLTNSLETTNNELLNGQQAMRSVFGELASEDPSEYIGQVREYNNAVTEEQEKIVNRFNELWKQGVISDDLSSDNYNEAAGTIGGSTEIFQLWKDYQQAIGKELTFEDTSDVFRHNKKFQVKDIGEISAEEMAVAVAQYRASGQIQNISEQGKNNADKTNALLDNYFVNQNFENITYKDLEQLQQNLDIEGKSKKELISQIAEQYGKNEELKKLLAELNKFESVEDFEKSGQYDVIMNRLVEGINTSLNDALSGKLNFIQDRLTGLAEKGLKGSQVEGITNLYTKAAAAGMDNVDNLLDKIAEDAGEEAPEVLNILSSLDYTGKSADEINQALASAGLSFELAGEQALRLAAIMTKSSQMTIEQAQETYNQISKIISKLKAEGDTIEEEQYKELIALNPALESYFTMMADGTYMLTGAAEEFKAAVQLTQKAALEEGIRTANETVAAYQEWGKNSLTVNGKKRVNQDSYTYGSDLDEYKVGYSDTTAWNKYGQITNQQLSILQDNNFNEKQIETWKAAIQAGEDYGQVIREVDAAFQELNISDEQFNAKLQENIEKAEKLQEALRFQDYQNEVANTGLDFKETEDYAQYLAETQEELNGNIDAARELAIANQRLDRGLSNLNDDFEDISKSLKKSKEGTFEYSQAIGKLKDNFADILNISSGDKLSTEFVEKVAKDSTRMTKILAGDAETIQEFREEAFNDVIKGLDFGDKLKNVKSELSELANVNPEFNWLDELNNKLDVTGLSADGLKDAISNIGEGATLSPEYTNALNAMLATGQITADDLNDIFGTIGYKPQVTTEYVDQQVETPEYTTYHQLVEQSTTRVPRSVGTSIIYDEIPSYTEKSWTVSSGTHIEHQKVPVAQIDSDESGAGKVNIINAGSQRISPSHGSTSGGKGGGGGGGGGGDRKAKEPKKASDEIERYHKIDKTIDSLSKQYDRLSAAKDKAFGTSRLRLIERENALLQQQTEAEKARLEEVKKYYADDRSAIEAYGAVIDENGVISNYDEIMQKELDTLNSAYEQYNAGGLSDEIIEAKEKEYEEFKKILGQFEETNGEYLDQLQKVEEAIRAEITAELERIQAKVEVQLELPDQQLKMIEFKLSRLEDRAFSSGEKIALWGKQAEIARNKFNILYSSLEEIFTLQDENGDWSGLNLTADQVQRLLAGDKIVLDEIKLTGENAAEIMEALKTKQDELIEQYNAMADAMKSIEEELTNQLDEYNEAIEKQISKMEKLGSIAQAMKDTINAVGKEVIGVPASVMRSINNNILKSSEARANAYKAEYEAQIKALIAAREALGKAQTEEDKKYWQDMINTTEEAMNDVKESMLAQIQDYAEQAATIFEETLTESLATMAKNMYGMTVDDAQTAFDRYTTLSEDFLQDYQKIYELSKMTRSIQASINDTDNIKAKQALRDLQEEINEYQAEGIQMTQYEVDYLNKKYELRLAEIALEEAQNAKDQVRLSRNADGGWGYVYTANQQNIDQAQQSYEDKLKELQDLNYQMLQETQSGILGLQKEFNDALMEIYSRRDLSKEEQEKQINSLRDFYIRRAKTLGTSLDTALANNKDTYDFWSNNRYGYGVSAPGNYIDTYGETFLGSLNPALTSGANLANSFVTQMGDINTPGSIIGDSYQSWWDYTNEVSNMFGLIANDGETFEEAINREMTGVSEDIDNTTDKVHELAQAMGEELPAAIENVSNIQSQWGPVLDEAAELIENLGTAIEGLIEKMNEYNDIDLKPLDIPDSSGLSSRYTAAIAAGSGNGGGGSGGIGGGFLSSEKDNDPFAMNGSNGSYTTLTKIAFLTPWDGGSFTYSTYSPTGMKKAVEEYYNTNRTKIGAWFIDQYKKGKISGAYVNSYGGSNVIYGPSFEQFKKWILISNAGVSFDTGGYTGKFGPEGKLAMLHEKELVLNKQDTLNMLKMVALARDALGQVSIGSSLIAQTAASGYASGQTGFNSQNVSIEAHFPNVVDHNEIEQAFNNLANYAAQNAYNFDLPQRVNLF